MADWSASVMVFWMGRFALEPGEPFLFKLHSPMNFIVGGGFFIRSERLPLTLEEGTLTVLEGDSFAGEAVLERLKPGEERLVGFSTDLATLVDRQIKDYHNPSARCVH